MSGGCHQAVRDLDHVRQVVAEECFSAEESLPAPGRVGLEVEAFPYEILPDGAPAGRVPLERLLRTLDEAVGEPPLGSRRHSSGGSFSFPLHDGGALTFEPGGQLEHSTAPRPSPAAALADVRAVAEGLAEALQPRRTVLASAGLDVWWPDAEVPQQLTAPRYLAMAAYFERRGPHGAVMMRRSCALQVNLDLGDDGQRAERWLVANLVSPIACATFACSPGPDVVSTRALAWQGLDPTRTGFPRRLVDGSSDDPVEQLATAACDADVLLLRQDPPPWEPGRPGWTFGDWLRDGHPEHGRPSVGDLRYHLSTLFPEVRARGFLELRALDSLPARFQSVPVVLLVGLLEDAKARAQVLAVVERHRSKLPGLWRRAATVGLADPALCAVAVETWSLALAGARRLPPGHLPADDLHAAESFLDRFTMRGRCPADELRELLGRDPAAALAWAAEPVPVRKEAPPNKAARSTPSTNGVAAEDPRTTGVDRADVSSGGSYAL
jgi:glutamate--cysteine ligase